MHVLLTRIATTGAAAGAAVAARKLVEVGWRRTRGEQPPVDGEAGEADVRDLLLWAVVLGGAVLLARKLATSATERLLSER